MDVKTRWVVPSAHGRCRATAIRPSRCKRPCPSGGRQRYWQSRSSRMRAKPYSAAENPDGQSMPIGRRDGTIARAADAGERSRALRPGRRGGRQAPSHREGGRPRPAVERTAKGTRNVRSRTLAPAPRLARLHRLAYAWRRSSA